jgi:hypothetical protein
VSKQSLKETIKCKQKGGDNSFIGCFVYSFVHIHPNKRMHIWDTLVNMLSGRLGCRSHQCDSGISKF